MARNVDAAIAELAARQHSAFSQSQALSNGMSQRMLQWRVRQGELRNPLPGVYNPAGAELGFKSHVMSAVLWAGELAVASHLTAGELHRIDGIRSKDVIDITVPRGRYPTADGIRTHRSLILGPADVTEVDGIALTKPVRTLIDAGLWVPPQDLEVALDCVQHRGYASHEYIARHLERLGAPLRPGSLPLVKLMLKRDKSWAPLESWLETKTWQLIEADPYLPNPTRQLPVIVRGRRFRLDMVYEPPVKLAIEPAGFRYHRGKLKWGLDKKREQLLVSLGYGILPVTYSDITFEPVETLAIIRDAYFSRMAG